MAKSHMTADEQAAHRLAQALATHEIPSHTPLHAALAEARAKEDAQLIARVAALAGISPSALLATQEAAQVAAEAAMHKRTASA